MPRVGPLPTTKTTSKLSSKPSSSATPVFPATPRSFPPLKTCFPNSPLAIAPPSTRTYVVASTPSCSKTAAKRNTIPFSTNTAPVRTASPATPRSLVSAVLRTNLLSNKPSVYPSATRSKVKTSISLCPACKSTFEVSTPLGAG